MKIVRVTAMLFAVLFSTASGQEAPKKPALAFEVASVRPGPPGTVMELVGSGKMHTTIDSSRIDFGSMPLSTVIQRAYRLPFNQVVGPDWLIDQGFDIQATLPAGASVDQVPDMLQTLLADRFGLQIHHEKGYCRCIP